MKLAYLCLEYTIEGKASYTHVYEIVNGLRKRGWEVIIYQPYYCSLKPGLFKRLIKFMDVQLRLWKDSRLDILYIRSHFAAWPTALWARFRGIPVVQEINGPYQDLFIAYPVTRLCAPLFRLLLRSQWRWARAVIAVTPQLAEWVRRESGNSRCYVVPNGVNVQIFYPNANTDLHLPDKFVLFFGALTRWQGIETMLEAVSRPEWPQEVKLVIAGDGALRSLVEHASNIGQVVYLGQVAYKDVPGIIAKSIACLSPKNSKGGRSQTGLFPLKVFEALACGVPVIVTDFPGQADLVREGECGIVVPPEDPRALAEAVAYLTSHPDERQEMGKRGREIVECYHSWDSRASDVARILQSIMGET